MTLDELSRRLHSKWGPDVAQDALVALLTTGTPPRNPLAFCNTVAWRVVARERYPHVGHGVTKARGEKRIVHVEPGPGYARRVDAVFGSTPPEQLRRLVAREALDQVHPDAIRLEPER